METHPCFGNLWATIHPCKHSHVMQKFVSRSADSGKELRVDQYLLLFLKVKTSYCSLLPSGIN
jgi:ubiquitin-like-conjugating enzyme ATG3